MDMFFKLKEKCGKTMISITTSSYDLNGQLILNEDSSSDLKSNRRRVSRTATLDGGCDITDQGFSHSDRTLRIRNENISQNNADTLWYLFQTYSLIQVSIPDGCYKAAIKDLKIDEGNLRMEILIKEEI